MMFTAFLPLMFTLFLPSLQSELVVAVIALLYTLLSVALQRKLSNPVHLQEIQLKMNAISKELNAMIKSNAPKEQIAAKQKEIMPLMSESMRAQFKPMLVILPLFFIVYYALVPLLPLGTKGLNIQESFFVAVLVFGLATSMVFLVKDRKKAKNRLSQQDSGNAANQTSMDQLSKKV
ncbi:MAG: EMC3/TMCO1 family protein [Candidatus Micrarchaeia archaeon]